MKEVKKENAEEAAVKKAEDKKIDRR